MAEVGLKAGRLLSERLRSVVSGWKHPAIIASLLVTGFVFGIRCTGGLQAWELVFYDQMTQWRTDAGPDDRLLVVAITEADIRAQLRWPLSDAVLAQLLAKLQLHRPAVIGIDLYRDIAQPPGRDRLLQQVRASNVVSIMLLGDETGTGVLPPPGIPDDQVGFSDFVLDSDAVVRRNLLYVSVNQRQYCSFALRLSLKYLGDRPVVGQPNFLQIAGTQIPVLTPNAGSYRDLDDTGWQILVNYRSPAKIARQLTLTQVLSDRFDPSWVTGKVVLIGTTAPRAKDLFVTPVTPFPRTHDSVKTPGVLVHAHMTSQLLDRHLPAAPWVWFWSEPGELAWIAAWATLGSAMAQRWRQPLALGGAALFASGGAMGLSFGLFMLGGWLPLLPALLALHGAICGVTAHRFCDRAVHDPLTGLPNRAQFLQQVQYQLKHPVASKSTAAGGNPPLVAVLFLGLDCFKSVNDRFGHRVGDQLLVAVAQRLQSCLGPSDYLARVGGDEFAVLPAVQNLEAANLLSAALQQRLTSPFCCAGQEVFLTISVGIVVVDRASADLPEQILRDAHTAMYQAKAAGKARQAVFATRMRAQVRSQLELETDLRHAWQQQELELHYQPIVALATGKIVGLEALVRWHHPTRGWVSPREFGAVAEAADLMLPLGQWIIRTASQQLRDWQSQRSIAALFVSVNLSGKQFAQPELVAQINQALQATGLQGGALRLEITETLAMIDVEHTIAQLQRLKASNLRLSLDNFGTGHSSLSYLNRFPIDTLKIDRSFIRSMSQAREDAQIVQTIIILGHTLGMTVVADGVENANQLASLRAWKCNYGQGDFFAPALSAAAIEELLQQDPRW